LIDQNDVPEEILDAMHIFTDDEGFVNDIDVEDE